MRINKKKTPGFTLVELAIVMTIIGLLIGGILKGQELLENARRTATGAQIKSYAAAVHTFKDAYGALPGDIVNPGLILPACATAPCNVSGDGNGEVGPVFTGSGAYYSDENNNFWLHLSKANLISGIDPNSTWTAPAYFYASMPASKMGGNMAIVNFGHSLPPVTQGVYGRYVFIQIPNATGAAGAAAITVGSAGKFDSKFDDGAPWTGSAILNNTSCGVANAATSYDPDNKSRCIFDVKMDF